VAEVISFIKKNSENYTVKVDDMAMVFRYALKVGGA